MMLRMRIQSALRLLPLWLVLSALNVGILVGLLAVRAASLHAPLSAGVITALAWAGIAAFLAVSGVRQRSSAFELTLPVSARRLWAAHAASTVAIAVILAFAMAGVAATQFRLLDTRRSLPIHPLHLAALLAAGAMLALALLELPHRESHRIPLHVRSAIWSVAVLAGVAVLLGGLAPLGIAAALVPAALACVAGRALLARLAAQFHAPDPDAGAGRRGGDDCCTECRRAAGRGSSPAGGPVDDRALRGLHPEGRRRVPADSPLRAHARRGPGLVDG